MRIIGQRKEHPITFSASAASLLEGACFNDELHRLPTGNQGYIAKGVTFFKTHEDANCHDQECLAAGMAKIAKNRRNCA